MLRMRPAAALLFLSASVTSLGCASDGAGDPEWVPNPNADAAMLTTPEEDAGATGVLPGPDAGTADAAPADTGIATPLDAGPVTDSTPEAGVDAGTQDAGADGDAGATTTDASAQEDAGPPPGAGDCLDGITDYGNDGPFEFKTEEEGKVKFWVPQVPAGCKVPVVHLANGTTANCANYQGALERLASHGFLTACYEDPDTGAGEYGITAFETAFSKYPDLADDTKLGSTGHSQGGQASIVTLQLAEEKWGSEKTYTALAMEPASGYGTQPNGQTWQQSYGKVTSPVFMFSGNSSTGFSNSALLGLTTGDGLVAISWVNEGFSALSESIEAYHWLAVGATHIPTPVGPEQQMSIPWFRWKLLGDQGACMYLKQMPNGDDWEVQKEQNPEDCQ